MDVLTLGESMVCLAPTYGDSLEMASDFRKRIAGAESNVSIGIARLGHHVGWLSRLGNDGFGRAIYKTLRGEGVDVSYATFDDTYSTGLYFKEVSGSGQVIVQYYRANSAASHLSPEDILRVRMNEVKYLFITGITPALSESCRQAVMTAIESAKVNGVKVVFDPNVRLKLWSESEARATLREIAFRSDIILPGVEEGKLITGESSASAIATELLKGNAQTVVVKLGAQGAYYQTSDEEGTVAGFSVKQVDEVGAGDAFAAGFMSGLLDGETLPNAVKRACALGALAVTGYGDYETSPYREQLNHFMNGTSQVQR